MKNSEYILFFSLLMAYMLPLKNLNAKSIQYEITPIFQSNTSFLQIYMTFSGDVDGETDIVLPNEFGNQQKLFRCIRDLSCANRDCRFLYNPDSTAVRIGHKPGQTLKVTYNLIQDYSGDEIPASNAFRPIVQPNYFHVYGSSLFLVPKGWCAFDLSIEWQGLPSNWAIHNSFGSQEKSQHLHFDSPKWLESVFVGGDFRISCTQVKGKDVCMAIRGRDWGFEDTELLDILRKTLEVQRVFWNDMDIPYYSVTLLPLTNPLASCGNASTYIGMGLINSFSAFVSSANKISIKDLYHLFNHEMMHDWIGGKIRNGGEANDMSLSWFSEGFTEYFAYKNMLSAGFITAAEFEEIFNNEIFANLYSSPIAELPNDKVAENFFKHDDVAKLAYKRGCVFAFYLDYGIKSSSQGRLSLHDFMLEMLDYYYDSDLDLKSNLSYFYKNLGNKYLKKGDFEAFFKKHITEGKLIPASEFVLPEEWFFTQDSAGIPSLHMKMDDTDLLTKMK